MFVMEEAGSGLFEQKGQARFLADGGPSCNLPDATSEDGPSTGDSVVEPRPDARIDHDDTHA